MRLQIFYDQLHINHGICTQTRLKRQQTHIYKKCPISLGHKALLN